MKLFNTKVSPNEEVDFDNKRLVYVNDLVPVTTHIDEEHTLSTDQVISLFDGGYRFGILDELDFVRGQSRNMEERVLILLDEFKKFHYEQKIDALKSNELISEIKTIFKEYRSKIESDLTKKFDICQHSNEKRIRDEAVRGKGEEFLDQLLKSFRNLGMDRGLF